jgi:hypothetical protein
VLRFVLALGLAGCEINLRELAVTTYEAGGEARATCRPVVHEIAVDNETYYSVVGCGREIAYRCTRGSSPRDRSRCVEATNVCTEAGCDSYETGARIAFGKDGSCPYDRIAITAVNDPIAPSPEVASDPERMAMWTFYHPKPTTAHGVMAVAGCGLEALYDCPGASGSHHVLACALVGPLRK